MCMPLSLSVCVFEFLLLQLLLLSATMQATRLQLSAVVIMQSRHDQRHQQQQQLHSEKEVESKLVSESGVRVTDDAGQPAAVNERTFPATSPTSLVIMSHKLGKVGRRDGEDDALQVVCRTCNARVRAADVVL